jgi:tetratricopeptide (TPR) repeat protein
VTAGGRQQAISALDAARPYLARLDVAGHPEDVAADLIEGWSAVETALRSLMGGSALAGQALVRELRQREILSLDTAHGLLAFLGARDRAQRTTYRPTGTDVATARNAFERLDTELRTPAVPTTGVAPGLRGATVSPAYERPAARGAVPLDVGQPPAVPIDDVDTMPRAEPRRAARARGWRTPVLLALLAVAAIAGGYFAYTALASRGGGGDVMAEGIELYRGGRREAARGAFERAARDNPRLAAPHVYLARIAREDGDYARANQELRTAISLEPGNLLAQREMGQFLLAAGNPDLARRFLIRAVQIDSADAAANGWLACALIRLNNRDIADRFLRRAGPGDWTACTNAPAVPPQPAAFPAGGPYPPGAQYPAGAPRPVAGYPPPVP